MEYTSVFEPLMMIFLSMLGGMLIGGLSTFYIVSRDSEDIKDELDKFRELYFIEVNKWKNKYIDDDPCDRFKDDRL